MDKKQTEKKTAIALKDRITKCTPRAVKLYHEAMLDEIDGMKFIENFTALVIDPEKTKALVEAMAGDLPADFKVEDDLDIAEFREAVLFFGLKSLGLLRG